MTARGLQWGAGISVRPGFAWLCMVAGMAAGYVVVPLLGCEAAFGCGADPLDGMTDVSGDVLAARHHGVVNDDTQWNS